MTNTATLTGTWTVDAIHSDATFKVRHMAVGKAKGSFAIKSAELVVPEAGLTAGSVTAVLDAASVDTKQEQRNEHVRSADFLDVENHPELTFVSTGIKDFDGDEFIVVGNLTIRGNTREVELKTEFLGATTDAYGAERVGFSAKTSISRKEFDVNFNAAFGAGNAVVADKVEIDLELEFTKNA